MEVVNDKKYQNLDKAKLLDKIDDDIQELNLLKSKLRRLEENKFQMQERIKILDSEEKKAESSNTSDNETPSPADWKDNTHTQIIKASESRQYRQYELAFDRVKLAFLQGAASKTNRCLQHPGTNQLQVKDKGPYDCLGGVDETQQTPGRV